ncbi:hypothetical protein [Psychrilyobacter atlanticus]|uniref:hypothetical protein n=1 Tax=Psychrilyobacter atlanticus TaxID=271091 RepID=UPI0004105377|nr:hypothetical protein [Psychrilyobacter atlanticus]
MKKFILMLIGITIFMTGCSSNTPKVSSLQRSQMRTKTIKANYDIAFRSVMIVLENQGYTVENTDYKTGLIKATAVRDATSGAEKFWLDRSGVITYDISTTITEISKVNSRVRINIRENTDIVQGAYGSKSAKDIDEPAVYASLFNELRTETERMKAINYTSIYEELRTELERVKMIK